MYDIGDWSYNSLTSRSRTGIGTYFHFLRNVPHEQSESDSLHIWANAKGKGKSSWIVFFQPWLDGQ